MSLYKLGEELRAKAENVDIDEETGEVVGMEDLIEAEAEFCEKAAAVAVVIRWLDDNIEGIKRYKRDLNDRQNRTEKRVRRLSQYLVDEMTKSGIEKIDRPDARIFLRRTRAVEIRNEDLIPMEYKVARYEASKTAIKAAIESGIEVPGAEVVENINAVMK